MSDGSTAKARLVLRRTGFTTEGGKPLDRRAIERTIAPEIAGLLRIEVLDETDSTNNVILGLPAPQRHGRVVMAERQTAGKGRRGRAWQSPAGNLFLSLGWRFDQPTEKLEALSLVAGVCTCEVLARMGLEGHGIKWPNDIMVDGAKLGGILVETTGNRQAVDAVIGIGINIFLGHEGAEAIDQPWTDLVRQPQFDTLDRNFIAADILSTLVGVLSEGSENFADFLRERWPHLDHLAGQPVRVTQGDVVYEGEARGIADDGVLRVLVGASESAKAKTLLMHFRSGEVTVRRA